MASRSVTKTNLMNCIMKQSYRLVKDVEEYLDEDHDESMQVECSKRASETLDDLYQVHKTEVLSAIVKGAEVEVLEKTLDKDALNWKNSNVAASRLDDVLETQIRHLEDCVMSTEDNETVNNGRSHCQHNELVHFEDAFEELEFEGKRSTSSPQYLGRVDYAMQRLLSLFQKGTSECEIVQNQFNWLIFFKKDEGECQIKNDMCGVHNVFQEALDSCGDFGNSNYLRQCNLFAKFLVLAYEPCVPSDPVRHFFANKNVSEGKRKSAGSFDENEGINKTTSLFGGKKIKVMDQSVRKGKSGSDSDSPYKDDDADDHESIDSDEDDEY